jgi:hypothetical protein
MILLSSISYRLALERVTWRFWGYRNEWSNYENEVFKFAWKISIEEKEINYMKDDSIINLRGMTTTLRDVVRV